jgi:chromosome partitioning protein
VPIIAISNQKGGVGKTTTTLNLGAALREAGKRVLLVDLDPQGSLTVAAGVLDVDAVRLSVGDLMIARVQGNEADLRSAIIPTPSGMDLVPGNNMLSAGEITLAGAVERESVLLAMLSPVIGLYDYVLIDCLPSLGLMVINALRAANGVVIPVQADFLAVQGLAQTLETIRAVHTQLNAGLEIYGVLLTMVDDHTSHAKRVVATVRNSLKGHVTVFEAQIAHHVSLKEAAEVGKTILDFQPQGAAADMYRDLAHEVSRASGDLSIAAMQPRRRGMFAEATRLFRGFTRGPIHVAESGRPPTSAPAAHSA